MSPGPPWAMVSSRVCLRAAALKIVNSPLIANAAFPVSESSFVAFMVVMAIRQGRISLETAASICAGWKGLTTQALAPAAWPSAFFESPASVVSMITGVNL